MSGPTGRDRRQRDLAGHAAVRQRHLGYRVRDRQVEGRVELWVVELSIQEGAELEMRAGHVAHGLAAVVALNMDRLFGQPPEACGDGAQSVKVPQLQLTGVHGLALLDHGHVSAGH